MVPSPHYTSLARLVRGDDLNLCMSNGCGGVGTCKPGHELNGDRPALTQSDAQPKIIAKLAAGCEKEQRLKTSEVGAVDMSENWGDIVRRFRVRHGLTQELAADVLGVSQRTVSRWERGQDRPSVRRQRQLRDLAWELSGMLLGSLAASIKHCPFPRALSRTHNLTLQTLSRPAIEKRPSVTEWVGRDLARIAYGVLEEMLDDRSLQRSIARREVSCILATTRSVLQTVEHPRIGAYRTVITYFFHEGTLFSDAISTPAPHDAICGFTAIPMDDHS